MVEYEVLVNSEITQQNMCAGTTRSFKRKGNIRFYDVEYSFVTVKASFPLLFQDDIHWIWYSICLCFIGMTSLTLKLEFCTLGNKLYWATFYFYMSNYQCLRYITWVDYYVCLIPRCIIETKLCQA